MIKKGPGFLPGHECTGEETDITGESSTGGYERSTPVKDNENKVNSFPPVTSFFLK